MYKVGALTSGRGSRYVSNILTSIKYPATEKKKTDLSWLALNSYMKRFSNLVIECVN